MYEEIYSAFGNFKKPNSFPSNFIDPGCGEKEAIELLLEKNADEIDKWTLTDIGTIWGYLDSSFVGYYLPAIMALSRDSKSQHPLIVDDIVSEISSEYSINGLTFDFREKWSQLNEKQLLLVNQWLLSISGDYPNYNFMQIEAVLNRLKVNYIRDIKSS